MTMFPRIQHVTDISPTAADSSTVHKCGTQNSKFCLLDFSNCSRTSLSKLPTNRSYDWVPMSICTMYTACSSTAHNGVFSGSEYTSYGGDMQRKSSSETRTSSSPDDSNNRSKDRVRDNHRPGSRGKQRRISQNNGLVPLERVAREFDPADLTTVLDENITGARLNPPIPHPVNKTRATNKPAVLRPLNSNDHLTQYNRNAISTHRHMNPLSISGLAKPEASAEDSNNGSSWTHTQNSKVPTINKHPLISSQQQNNNNSDTSASSSSNNSASTLTASQQQRTDNSLPSSLAITSSSTGGSSNPRRFNKQMNNNQSSLGGSNKQTNSSNRKAGEAEPKYADPIAGASSSFQARLSELAALEAETVRYERLKKIKKKNKERDD